jgi:hypothetical protein
MMPITTRSDCANKRLRQEDPTNAWVPDLSVVQIKQHLNWLGVNNLPSSARRAELELLLNEVLKVARRKAQRDLNCVDAASPFGGLPTSLTVLICQYLQQSACAALSCCSQHLRTCTSMRVTGVPSGMLNSRTSFSLNVSRKDLQSVSICIRSRLKRLNQVELSGRYLSLSTIVQLCAINGSRLRRLNLSAENQRLGVVQLLLAASQCPSLESFALAKATALASTPLKLSDVHLPSLHHLVLKSCNFNGAACAGKALRTFLLGCPNLKRLECVYCVIPARTFDVLEQQESKCIVKRPYWQLLAHLDLRESGPNSSASWEPRQSLCLALLPTLLSLKVLHLLPQFYLLGAEESALRDMLLPTDAVFDAVCCQV